jgi:pimeloyl-ACP methyl ester carboxylesterase
VKKLIIIVILIAGLGRLNAQDISGSWAGVIAVSGVHLHLVFNVKKLTDTSYSSTMDSPDQKAFGIACNATYLKKDSLFISVAIIKGGYNGLWKGGDTISGIFRQGGARIPIGLKRISAAEKAQLSTDPVRPQTPKPPFAYFSEEVEYDNADKSMHYGATFTRPSGDGKYPAAIIISGSGTQDRDGTMMKGHKPYLVLADYLTKHGIAVLRVDDRGAGKSSMGPDINSRTSLDFSYDVETSLNYLETRGDVDKKHLGLIGHSEGGAIAPMVAARRKDVSFIVLWGAPEAGGAKTLAEQYTNVLVQQGVDTASANAYGRFHLQVLQMFAVSPGIDTLDKKISNAFDPWETSQTPSTLKALNIGAESLPGILKMYNSFYNQPWLRYFIAYNPAGDLSKVKCPVLAVNGEKDTQVNAAENLAAIKAILTKSSNKDFEVKALPGLNHLLQTANTGQLSEYAEIQETMSPAAMNIISEWIKLHTK